MKNWKPIIYEYNVDVRFADLDMYGHLNVRNYLDLIVTSRLLYLERVLKTPMMEFTKKGLGFYMAKVTQEFLRPVTGMNQLCICSFIDKVEKSRFFVPYKMTDPNKTMLFSKGLMEFAIVDLKTQKPVAEIPEWGYPYFFVEV